MNDQPSIQRTPLIIYVLIVSLATAAFLASDMYVPSLPALMKSLHTSETLIKLTITLYMLGVVISQLISGPWSDAVGRRAVVLQGIAIMLLGSVLAAVAHNSAVFVVGRLLQGIGAGACMGLARIIARDIASGKSLAKIGSYMGLCISFAPAVAPLIGGYLQTSFGWRANFYVLFGVYTLLITMIWRHLPETHPLAARQPFRVGMVLHNYRYLLTNRYFINASACTAIGMGGILAYMTVTPFLYQVELGLTPVGFGWWTVLIVAGSMLGRAISLYLISRYTGAKIVHIGMCLMASGGIVMLLLAWLLPMTVWGIAIPMLLFTLGVGINVPNLFSQAMTPFKTMAGSAGALFGSLSVCGSVATTLLMAHLPSYSQWALAIVLSVAAVFGLIFNQWTHTTTPEAAAEMAAE